MIGALKQLSYIVGTVLALIVLMIALAFGMPLGVAVFRAVVVMCVGTAVVALFFRCFTVILYHFLQEKVAEHKQTEHKRGEPDVRRGVARRTGK